VGARHVLLIDPDVDFQRQLAAALAPYDVDVEVAVDGAAALDALTEPLPALIVIAVEEPGKQGFLLCTRAKRGASAGVPVMLVTASVSPAGMASHQRLKAHAEAYVDKRALTPALLLAQLEALIDLSTATNATMDGADMLPFELDGGAGDDEIPVELDGGAEVEEVEVGLDEPVDGAIGAPLAGPADDELDAALDLALGADDDAPRATAAARPAFAGDAPRTSAVVADDETESAFAALTSTEAPAIADPGAAELVLEEAAVSAASPEATFELDAEPEAEVAVEAAVEPELAFDMPAEADEPSDGPFAVNQPTVIASPPSQGPTEAPHVPAPAPELVDAAVDLGLDAVADQAREEQSGVHDRRTLQRIHNLERENGRLKNELEKLRLAAEPSTGVREREFLALRELVAGKDQELSRLRDAAASRDADASDALTRLKSALAARTAAEQRAAELAATLANATSREGGRARRRAAGRGRGRRAPLAAGSRGAEAEHPAARGDRRARAPGYRGA
jgi:CheY-like chemotaxis protein